MGSLRIGRIRKQPRETVTHAARLDKHPSAPPPWPLAVIPGRGWRPGAAGHDAYARAAAIGQARPIGAADSKADETG